MGATLAGQQFLSAVSHVVEESRLLPGPATIPRQPGVGRTVNTLGRPGRHRSAIHNRAVRSTYYIFTTIIYLYHCCLMSQIKSNSVHNFFLISKGELRTSPFDFMVSTGSKQFFV